ncbi:hypothetical protein L2X83_16970, partial [Enterobacter asburiae]|uniref:hypothetical protein n=1 Tax=Enterobacter asburiae TaxID=61645 RepID=UPI001F4784E0
KIMDRRDPMDNRRTVLGTSHSTGTCHVMTVQAISMFNEHANNRTADVQQRNTKQINTGTYYTEKSKRRKIFDKTKTTKIVSYEGGRGHGKLSSRAGRESQLI